MGYTSFSLNRTINKDRRDDTVKAPWKNSEKQDYSQKGINMNTHKSNMTRSPLQKIAKIWRRKLEGKQQLHNRQTRKMSHDLIAKPRCAS